MHVEMISYMILRLYFSLELMGNKYYQNPSRKKSSWAIGEGILEAVKNLLTKDSNILELGSGIGSKSLAEICTTHSVEHDSRFLNVHDSVNYIHSPLVEIKPLGEYTKLEKQNPMILK